MEDDVLINSETMAEIADAIREKTGKTYPMYPRDMPGEIDGIDTSEAGATDAEWINRTIKTVKFPEGITEIPACVFHNCKSLVISELPNTLKTIRSNQYRGTFASCVKINIDSFPESLELIEPAAFNSCLAITYITFRSKPSIANNVFTGCRNLLNINVPWSENEVAGAPWGATNATINYNYEG